MYKQLVDDIKSIGDLESVIEYYYPNQLKNKTMKCPFNSDSTPKSNFPKVNTVNKENINQYYEEKIKNSLEYCYETYDGEDKYIQMLCDAIITNNYFDEDLKKTLIRKWLLNTACIAFNEDDCNLEGVLTFQ